MAKKIFNVQSHPIAIASSFSPAPASVPKAACPPFAQKTVCGPAIASRMSARPTHGSAIRRVYGRSTRRAATRARKPSPTPAHIALAELEARLAGRYFLCTQNVDDLHERAGSRNLVHMHGELAKARCETRVRQTARCRHHRLRQPRRGRPLRLRWTPAPAHRFLR